jgi:hypothetical protein
MAIIGIFGYAGSGKDTVGKLIQYNMSRSRIPIEEVVENYSNNEWWMEEQSGWEIKKWAGKLKYIASIITGIPVEKFEDQEFKKTNLGSEWDQPIPGEDWVDGKPVPVPMTVRDLLQILGTEAMRDGLHKNVWVNALMADYKIHPEHFNDIANGRETGDGYPNWIITDTRFPNEAQAIKDKGGMVIKVDRPGVGPVNGHPSEDALKDYNFDYVIHNDGSINDLDNKVIEFINNYIFTPN